MFEESQTQKLTDAEGLFKKKSSRGIVYQDFLKKEYFATFIGLLAIIFWSFGASCAVLVRRIPIFEALTITFFLASLPSLARIIIEKAWQKLRQPLRVWVFGVISLGLQQWLYLQAFRHGHPAQVDVLIYCWPLVFMIFSSIFLKEAIGKHQVFAVLIGIGSIVLLKSSTDGFFCSISVQGYCYAILSAVLWALYCVYIRFLDVEIEYVVGFYFGIGSIVMLLVHLTYEPFVTPTMDEGGVLCFIGLVMTGLGYSFWAYGIRQGHSIPLAVLSYLNPFLSVFILWKIGLASLNIQVLFASLGLGLSGWMSALKPFSIKNKR